MRGRLTLQLRVFGSQAASYEQTAEKMTQRTFEEGTPWPPFKGESLRLYSMRFCPYAQRARLVLAHKNIQYETVNVHLKRKPSWLFERNPKGRVPIVEHPDGRLVYESLTVCQYLDDIYPDIRLTPADPYRKARDRLLPEFCNKLMMATYQMLFSDGQSEEARGTFLKGFHIYEAELVKRLPEGPFFGGSKPAMVDYMLWPWFERLPMLPPDDDDDDDIATRSIPASGSANPHPVAHILPPGADDTGLAVGVSARRFPRLHQWMSAMFGMPAVKATMFDLQAHWRFGRSQLTADPEYDVGLEDEPPVPPPPARL